eukprot:gnl/TRDRNA2_/TRDRNA2_161605_c0_seq1.p1 gnl/TRDRNA2_/TRDRNA2_161605_c0~~gnl/TRDRNA2_/TRDRNA2_161605_c0_seq1.p1  ORF type:complete len:250 (+),score=41.33 gnl/TRDRNA2_/TRDRNA2_161605_c0_seq1:3-752(+)
MSNDWTLSTSSSSSSFAPVVVMRDFPSFQILNSAGVFFRRGPASRFFLKLLLQKIHWQGMADFDQSAFDHTLLEFLDFWWNIDFAAEQDFRHWSSTRCLIYFFPWLNLRSVLERYYSCWHEIVDEVMGSFGERLYRHRVPLFLADPRKVDFNFVLGGRGFEDAPLIWHLAGKDKNLRVDDNHSMFDLHLRNLWGRQTGCDPWEGTSDCKLPPGSSNGSCAVWEALAGDEQACDPGTQPVDCRKGWTAFC